MRPCEVYWHSKWYFPMAYKSCQTDVTWRNHEFGSSTAFSLFCYIEKPRRQT